MFSEGFSTNSKYHWNYREQSIFPCKCLRGTDIGLYIYCENTNLASLAVGFENLAAIQAPIEELTIAKSHFEELYGNLLFKLKVRVLRIEETPLVHINEHVFQGVNRTLQELYISNTSLKEFPKLAFKVSAAAANHHCYLTHCFGIDFREFNFAENRPSRARQPRQGHIFWESNQQYAGALAFVEWNAEWSTTGVVSSE